MNYEIDMKRLHQGCGESLQSHLPGVSVRKRTLRPGVADGQPKAPHRMRPDRSQRRDESDFR